MKYVDDYISQLAQGTADHTIQEWAAKRLNSFYAHKYRTQSNSHTVERKLKPILFDTYQILMKTKGKIKLYIAKEWIALSSNDKVIATRKGKQYYIIHGRTLCLTKTQSRHLVLFLGNSLNYKTVTDDALESGLNNVLRNSTILVKNYDKNYKAEDFWKLDLY